MTCDRCANLQHKLTAKIAECNTLAIELAIAKKRHATLTQFWGVLDHADRMALFAQIFEKGVAR